MKNFKFVFIVCRIFLWNEKLRTSRSQRVKQSLQSFNNFIQLNNLLVSKMKILTVIRNHFREFTICPYQQKNVRQFLLKNAAYISISVVFSILPFLAIILDRSSVSESMFIEMCGIVNLIMYFYIMSQKYRLLNLLNEFEKTVQKRKIPLLKFKFLDDLKNWFLPYFVGMKNSKIAKKYEQLNNMLETFNSIFFLVTVK